MTFLLTLLSLGRLQSRETRSAFRKSCVDGVPPAARSVEDQCFSTTANSSFERKTRQGVPTSKGADRMIDRPDDLLGGCTIVSAEPLKETSPPRARLNRRFTSLPGAALRFSRPHSDKLHVKYILVLS